MLAVTHIGAYRLPLDAFPTHPHPDLEGRCRGESIAIHWKPKQGGWVDPFLNSISTFIWIFPAQLVHLYHHPLSPATFAAFLYWIHSTWWQTTLSRLLYVVIRLFLGFAQVNCTVSVHRSFFSFDVTLHWRHEMLWTTWKFNSARGHNTLDLFCGRDFYTNCCFHTSHQSFIHPETFGHNETLKQPQLFM